MRKSKNNNHHAMLPKDGKARAAKSFSKKTLLASLFATILAVLSAIMLVAQEIPTVRGGGGSISSTDNALELYRFYTKMNTAATELPDDMDEAIYTINQDTGERSLVFFYRFDQANRVYPIKNNPGQNITYLNGWIITPDLCLHDIGSDQLEQYNEEGKDIGYQWECRWDEQECTMKAYYKALFPLAVRVRIWQGSLGCNSLIISVGFMLIDFIAAISIAVFWLYNLKKYILFCHFN